MQGLSMPTVNLLVAMLVISFISTILEDITETKEEEIV